MPTRRNLCFADQIAIDRRYNPYIYGGNWDPFRRDWGTDCSGCVIDLIDASINGTAMQWRRNADDGGGSTEDFRPYSMGGNADPQDGPFGLIMVDHPDQFPADAAVRVAFHHGYGGGENSHTWCQIDQLAVETHGSGDDFPDGATVINSRDSELFNDDVLSVFDTSYANNWWFLPGPIEEDGTPLPTGPSPLPDSVPWSERKLHVDGPWRAGLARREGQRRRQDNHVATSVVKDGVLGWQVLNESTGDQFWTKQLAHASHWKVDQA